MDELEEYKIGIKSVFDNLCNTKFDRVEVEKTQNNSIIYDLFLGDLEFSLELFLEPSEGKEKSTFFSMYKDKEYIANSFGSFDEMIDKLNSAI